MAKKKKPNKQSTEYTSEQELLRERWMLRLKVGTVYIIAWFVIMLWMTGNLPNPINADYFFQNSNAHWFINIGLAVIFFVIQIEIGKKKQPAAD